MTETNEFYNLSDSTQGIPRTLAPGATTRIFVGDQSMLSVAEFEPGAKGVLHAHPEEQWGVLLEGSGIRTQNGVAHAVQRGDFWRTPGDIEHGFTAGPTGAKIMDIFSPPRAAYRKAGSGFAT